MKFQGSPVEGAYELDNESRGCRIIFDHLKNCQFSTTFLHEVNFYCTQLCQNIILMFNYITLNLKLKLNATAIVVTFYGLCLCKMIKLQQNVPVVGYFLTFQMLLECMNVFLTI